MDGKPKTDSKKRRCVPFVLHNTRADMRYHITGILYNKYAVLVGSALYNRCFQIGHTAKVLE